MPLIPLLFPSSPSSAFTLSPPPHSLAIAGASGLCRCLANFASFPFDTITTRYVSERGSAAVCICLCVYHLTYHPIGLARILYIYLPI